MPLKFNLRAPIFQDFPGGKGMPPDPLALVHAMHADCALHNKSDLRSLTIATPYTKGPHFYFMPQAH